MGISNFSNFSPKSKLDAESFVKSNLTRLAQLFNIEDDTTMEEKEKILIDYLSKYPDQIKSLSLQFPNKEGSVAPIVQSIGGTMKY
jgi:hypothetical protein